MEQTICLFGDSIAWGAWDPRGGGWGGRLRSYFETNNSDIFVYNCGVSGDNSTDLLKRFNAECKSRSPNIIIVAIGINDSYYYGTKSKPGVSIKKFQNNLQELINQAKKFTKQIIFFGLTSVDDSKTQPIPWETTIYHDSESTKLYDGKIKEVCEKNNLPFVSMLDLLDKSDLEDGVHPNTKGHKKMFLRIKDFLLFNGFV